MSASGFRTPSQTATPFFTVQWSPRIAPVSTNEPSPMLQSRPTTAPRMTWACAQTRVPGPTVSDSHRPRSWTNTSDDANPVTRSASWFQWVTIPFLSTPMSVEGIELITF